MYVGFGSMAGRNPQRLTRLVGRAGHWLVPAIFIAIGVVILATSGVLPHLRDLLR